MTTGIKDVGELDSKYPHNPNETNTIPLIKLAECAFIFFFFYQLHHLALWL